MTMQRINPSTVPARLVPFADPSSVAFCHALSRILLQDPNARHYADLIALAYWLRPAHIERLLAPYVRQQKQRQQEQQLLRPLGHIFHAAPSNVDSLFVYSGIVSLLCGNLNTIRLSTQAGGSTELLCQYFQQLAASHPEASARFQVVRSERQAKSLLQLQNSLDGRVLWGSDEGIQALRQWPLPAHAREFTFAHKLSLAVLDVQAVLNASEIELQQLVQAFARDNLTFAQQACSSAKVVVWHLGCDTRAYAAQTEQRSQAQHKFWQAFTAYLQTEAGQRLYPLTESEHYRALNNAQDLAMAAVVEQIELSGAYVRVRSARLQQELVQFHQGCGLFVELQVQNLAELNEQLTPQQQTVTYWGLTEEQGKDWLATCLVGVDRLVPVGEALTFSPVWDGIDLFQAFSRLSR